MKIVNAIIGDCRESLRTLPEASVHCCVTSPPYWGLRDYGLDPLVWGGKPSCQHEWGTLGKRHRGGPPGRGEVNQGRDRSAQTATGDIQTGAFCVCGAWRGCLGLEPTPDLYVEHMVDVFEGLRRVLRDDGTLWLNLGDSYATGAGKVANCPGGGEQGDRWRERYFGKHNTPGNMAAYGSTPPNRMPIPRLKPKDLIGIPWRVAFALQSAGWYLRSEIIWHKPNPMPESVTDRPTKAHETVFLISKSPRYYYDAEAIAEPCESSQSDRRKMMEKKDRIGGKHKDLDDKKSKASRHTNIGRKRSVGNAVTRNRRTVWTIPTTSYKGAHFATFPPELAKTCILAGCPGDGVTIDPFGGSGTVGEVAAGLGRRAILCEQNPDYLPLIRERCGLWMNGDG